MQKLDDARYDSVADFVDSLSIAPRASRSQATIDLYASGQRHWYGAGCDTPDAVKALVRDGWPEGQKAVAELLAQLGDIEMSPVDRRRRLTRSDSGDSVDMGAVYRGRLDVAWTRAVRRPCYAPQKIDLVANMVCSGAESPDVLKWRGVAAIALADKLQAAGYMVRISVGDGGLSLPAREPFSVRVVVKDYDKPLDISTAATVTLPGFARGLLYQWLMRHSTRYVDAGISTVGECKQDAGDIYLSHDVRDRDSAMTFLRCQIVRLNDMTQAA